MGVCLGGIPMRASTTARMRDTTQTARAGALVALSLVGFAGVAATARRGGSRRRGCAATMASLQTTGDTARFEVYYFFGRPKRQKQPVSIVMQSVAEISIVPSWIVEKLQLPTEPKSASESIRVYRRSQEMIVGEVVLTFEGIGRHVVAVTEASEKDADCFPPILGRDLGPSMLVEHDRVVVNGVQFPAVRPLDMRKSKVGLLRSRRRNMKSGRRGALRPPFNMMRVVTFWRTARACSTCRGARTCLSAD